VKDMTAEAVALGLSVDDIGAMAAGDFWALLANAPFAMAWCLLYVLQADRQLLRDVLAEIDAAYASAQDQGQGQVSTSQMDVPLLTSCFYETLRLQSSSFSVREASQQAVLGDTVIEKGESVVCITRAGHLDTAVWGDDAQLWDGRRFYDDPAAAGQNLLPDEQRGAKCIPHVRAFGGGVSICEGRTLALSEAKAFLVPVLRTFALEISPETVRISGSEAKPIVRMPTAYWGKVHAPLPVRGRPGLGIMQLAGEVHAHIGLRKL